MIQDIYRRASGQRVYGDGREKFRLLWTQFNKLDYMWTLLMLLRAFEAGGCRARAQVIEGTRHQCYLHVSKEEECCVVRYIHNETPLYNLYPSQLEVLEKIVTKEGADHLIIANRTVFTAEAESQAQKLGITLRDGFDLMKLIETTVMRDNPDPLCPACGSGLVLKIAPAAAEGIAWVCTGVRKKECDSKPRPIGGKPGTDDDIFLHAGG
jgi:hypothetical protein